MIEKLTQFKEKIKSDRKTALVTAGVAAAVVLVAAVSIGNSATSNKKVLTRAFVNLADARSYHVKTDLQLPLPARSQTTQPLGEVAVAIEGDVLQSENTAPQLQGHLSIEARGRGMVLFTDGRLSILPSFVAFKLDNLPTLLNPKGNLVNKWTRVETPLLETKNPSDVRAALGDIIDGMEFREAAVHTDHQNLGRLLRFERTLTPDQEAALIEIIRQGKSGNRGLHVLARLMRGYDVEKLHVWVDEGKKQIRIIEAQFVRQTPDGNADERKAALTLVFTDYGKQVAIEEPETELSVRPEVFSKIFGSGEIENLE